VAHFQRIGAPLTDLLRSLGLETPMAGWEAVEAWAETVGERVAAHARAVNFRDGVLFVEVDTAAWMNELAYLRRRIVNDLNDKLGQRTVTEIRLVPAGRSETSRPTGEDT
jgi:predicted nucleic acid-binding Zn ribbon protein